MGVKVMEVIDVTLITLESQPPQYVINAKGEVPTGGWTNPCLEPRFYMGGTVPDGVQDYDFVAEPPNGGVNVTQAKALVSAALYLGRLPDLIKGVRIHSETNDKEELFDRGSVIDSITVSNLESAMSEIQGGVDAWPWSVKQQVPQSVPVSLRDIIGRTVRVLRPGDRATQEVMPGRVTIYLDDKGRVTDVVVEPGSDT